MLADTLAAIQDLPFAAALRSGRWSYAAVNGLHIVGIALLFGAIVPLDLRMMGFWRSVRISTLSRVLTPVAVTGVVLAVAAGLLLFSVRAVQYAGTAVFQIKLALILCAVANALLLRRAIEWELAQDTLRIAPPARLRLAGALSMALWLAVIACGRTIAFVD
jgi:hypothetical protein